MPVPPPVITMRTGLVTRAPGEGRRASPSPSPRPGTT
jgi:hypothetical protein